MKERIIKYLDNKGLFKHFNYTHNIYLNGSNFRVPIRGGIGLSYLQEGERWMTELLMRILPHQKGLFVDIGVNIGQTLLKVKSISKDVEYIGFEPNPVCIAYIKDLIDKNNFRNVVVLPIGISDETRLGELFFLYDSVVDSCASVVPGFRGEKSIKKREFVPLFNFSSLENIDLSQVSVLKIDVEGGEMEVLKSFFKVVSQNFPIIIVEILPAYDVTNTKRIERQQEIEILIKEKGYTIFRIVKKEGLLNALVEIKNLEVHSDMFSCDYIMVPQNKKSMFSSNMKEFLN